MATISGVWVFNNTVSVGVGSSNITYSVNFSSNGKTFTSLRRMRPSDSSSTGYLRYIGSVSVYAASGKLGDATFKEENQGYRTVDFGTAQTVDDTFVTWLTANATQKITKPISGKWVFNLTPTLMVLDEKVNFTSYRSYDNVANCQFYGFKCTSTTSYLNYYETPSELTWQYLVSSGWRNDKARTIDFGDEEKTVSDTFYNWLTTNATQQVANIAEITYNGTTTSLEEGQTAAMSCNGKVMASDIVVAFTEAGSVTYNGKSTNVGAGQTATLPCNGKVMLSDVVVS